MSLEDIANKLNTSKQNISLILKRLGKDMRNRRRAITQKRHEDDWKIIDNYYKKYIDGERLEVKERVLIKDKVDNAFKQAYNDYVRTRDINKAIVDNHLINHRRTVAQYILRNILIDEYDASITRLELGLRYTDLLDVIYDYKYDNTKVSLIVSHICRKKCIENRETYTKECKENTKKLLYIFNAKEVSDITGINSATLLAWKNKSNIVNISNTNKIKYLYLINKYKDLDLIVNKFGIDRETLELLDKYSQIVIRRTKSVNKYTIYDIFKYLSMVEVDGCEAISERYGISISTLMNWITLYSDIELTRKNKYYNKEFKHEVVDYYKKYGIQRTCSTYDVNRANVYRWNKEGL